MGTETHELNVTQDFFPQSGKAKVPLDKLSGLPPWRPLEKGAAWSYWKHHHSINTQSSLGKLEQLDIEQGQSGQVRAHLRPLCKVKCHQIAKPKFRDLVPLGLYQFNLINLNRVTWFSSCEKRSRLGPIPLCLYSNVLPSVAQTPAWGDSKAWHIPKKFRAEREGGGSVCERCTHRNVRARACDMHSRQPSRGEPQVLLRHMAPTHTSWTWDSSNQTVLSVPGIPHRLQMGNVMWTHPDMPLASC